MTTEANEWHIEVFPSGMCRLADSDDKIHPDMKPGAVLFVTRDDAMAFAAEHDLNVVSSFLTQAKSK